MQPTNISLNLPSTATHDLLTFFTLAALALGAVLHLVLATAVVSDTVAYQKRHGRLIFLGPLTWAFVVLMSGLLGFVTYWLMHYSSLRREPSPQDKTYENPTA